MAQARPPLRILVVDTNVLIRHLTGDPPGQARRATRLLASADDVVLTDVVVAECVYVLESYYRVGRDRVADLMRTLIAYGPVKVLEPQLLLRALQVYERERLQFADAYIVAVAELAGAAVASFDRAIDRAGTVRRVEP